MYFPFVIFNFPAGCSNLDGRKVSRYAANSFLGGCWRVDEVTQGVGHAIAGMVIYSDEKRVGVVGVVFFLGPELFPGCLYCGAESANYGETFGNLFEYGHFLFPSSILVASL